MEGSAFKRAARLHPYSVGSQVTGGLDMRQPEDEGPIHPHTLGSQQAG